MSSLKAHTRESIVTGEGGREGGRGRGMGAQAGSGQSKLTLEAIYTPHVKKY